MSGSNGSGVVRSVNVGQPRELLLRGKPYQTGIFKEPVEGRVGLSGNQVAGDVQCDPSVHGGRNKAVYAYTVEDYAWWEQILGTTLAPGTFGENLTLEGISAIDALVGERWEVGSAILQVTQPREPCWKLGAKMGDKEFPRRFREAGRAGAYFSIVQKGDVAAGDPVRVTHRPTHPVSLGMLAHLNTLDRRFAHLIMRLAGKDLTPEEWDEVLGPLQLPASYPQKSSGEPSTFPLGSA